MRWRMRQLAEALWALGSVAMLVGGIASSTEAETEPEGTSASSANGSEARDDEEAGGTPTPRPPERRLPVAP